MQKYPHKWGANSKTHVFRGRKAGWLPHGFPVQVPFLRCEMDFVHLQYCWLFCFPLIVGAGSVFVQCLFPVIWETGTVEISSCLAPGEHFSWLAVKQAGSSGCSCLSSTTNLAGVPIGISLWVFFFWRFPFVGPTKTSGNPRRNKNSWCSKREMVGKNGKVINP